MTVAGVEVAPVAVSAVAAFLLGWLWYSPIAFAKPWMRLNGFEPSDIKPTPAPFVVNTVCWIAAAAIYNVIATGLLSAGFVDFLILSIVLWLGFTFGPAVTGAMFSKKPIALVCIDTGYWLGGFVLFAVAHAFLG